MLLTNKAQKVPIGTEMYQKGPNSRKRAKSKAKGPNWVQKKPEGTDMDQQGPKRAIK
jgi:hypothetical protein